MLVVGVVGRGWGSRCDTGVAQGFPIGRLEHQNMGRTSLAASAADVEAGEHPIAAYEEAAVEATQPHLRGPGEQNLWAEAGPMSSSVGVDQAEKCKMAVGPLD